jgi:hypothetical protein
MRIRALLLVVIFFGAAIAYADDPRPVSGPGPGKIFLYTAKKLGLPILKASLHIENVPPSQGKLLYQVRLEISSVNLGFLFRMNNRFTSTMESDTCMPVQYIKEIDQDGLLKEKKNYLETLTFDPGHQRVWVERKGVKEKREVSLPPETFDPLSMFARCYLKENLQPSQEIRMSIYDGMKIRQLVFHPKKEMIKSKIYGEVDAIRLEATTSFASFGDREGVIRIWYTNDGKKIPILMELDLPVGSVMFELDEAKEG